MVGASTVLTPLAVAADSARDVIVERVMLAVFLAGGTVILFFFVRWVQRLRRAGPTPVFFRTAGPRRFERIKYVLTAGLELGEDTLVCTGKRFGIRRFLEVGVEATGDPAGLAQRIATVNKGVVRLEIDRTDVRLTDAKGTVCVPRAALEYVVCVGGNATGKCVGHASAVNYICLHVNDKRIGLVAIDAVPFTIGVSTMMGTQQDNTYRESFAESESRAQRVAEVLGIPYQTNYYTGIFARLAFFYR